MVKVASQKGLNTHKHVIVSQWLENCVEDRFWLYSHVILKVKSNGMFYKEVGFIGIV